MTDEERKAILKAVPDRWAGVDEWTHDDWFDFGHCMLRVRLAVEARIKQHRHAISDGIFGQKFDAQTHAAWMHTLKELEQVANWLDGKCDPRKEME